MSSYYLPRPYFLLISQLCSIVYFKLQNHLGSKTSSNTSHKVYVKVVFVLPDYWSQMPQGRSCQVGPVKQQMSTLASANILGSLSFGCLPPAAGSWCRADFLSFNILFWLIWSEVVLRCWDHDTLWDKQFVTQPFSLLRRLRFGCQASLVLPDITSVSVSHSVSQTYSHVGSLIPFHEGSAWRTSSQCNHVALAIFHIWSGHGLPAYFTLIGLCCVNLTRLNVFVVLVPFAVVHLSISPFTTVFVGADGLAHIWRDQETS